MGYKLLSAFFCISLPRLAMKSTLR